jgi:phosphate-selective porin
MMTPDEKEKEPMRSKPHCPSPRTSLKISLALGALAGTLAAARPAAAQDQSPPATPPADTAAPAPVPATPAPDATMAPAPLPAPAPMPAPALAPMTPEPAPAAPAEEPLAGFSNGTAFLRSPDNAFVLFPNGRLQTDGYFFKTDSLGAPHNGFLLKRARLELAGWVDNIAYFQIGADFAVATPSTTNSPAAQTNINATDDFVAVAPCEDRVILQVGQFDAPFTLENRTSDKYFDFMERSVTVRAFGIPSNKEQGMMLHGTNPERNYYYSAAVLNGDGQNFRNLDGSFDVMARAWIAPLSFGGPAELHDITLGGSYWTGNRSFGTALASQTTEAGFTFLKPSVTLANPGMGKTYELHQQGRLHAYAFEVNAPIAHKFGVRWEYVHKDQPLSEDDITTPSAPSVQAGLRLKGYSTYGEAWFWAMGDDRIIGEPGMQMPTRLKKFGVKAPQHGLMFAVRVDYLDEDLGVEPSSAALVTAGKSAAVGKTKMTAVAIGANYWISKRFRTTLNYVHNSFDGDTTYLTGLASKTEQEFLFRLAIAL